MSEKRAAPAAIFQTRVRDDGIASENPYRWHEVTTHDLFRGKRVVVLNSPVRLHRHALRRMYRDMMSCMSR